MFVLLFVLLFLGFIICIIIFGIYYLYYYLCIIICLSYEYLADIHLMFGIYFWDLFFGIGCLDIKKKKILPKGGLDYSYYLSKIPYANSYICSNIYIYNFFLSILIY